jgi:hypothetical protein
MDWISYYANRPKIQAPKIDPQIIYDRLGRRINVGDILVVQKNGTGINKLMYVSLFHNNTWYVSEIFNEMYTDKDTEYLPVPGTRRLVMKRETVEYPRDYFRYCIILREIPDDLNTELIGI